MKAFNCCGGNVRFSGRHEADCPRLLQAKELAWRRLASYEKADLLEKAKKQLDRAKKLPVVKSTKKETKCDTDDGQCVNSLICNLHDRCMRPELTEKD